MSKDVISVGVANEGELNIGIDVVRTWEPKNINYVGDVVFFKQDKTYYSMKRNVFNEIFNK